MGTVNYYLGPEDGWTLVAADPGFISVAAYPRAYPFYIYYGSAPPTDYVSGVYVQNHPFWDNVTSEDNFYVYVPRSAPDTSKLRIDVFTIGAGGPPVESALLLETGDNLDLEDGTSHILLES